jgi:hypothetical protein
MIMTMADKDDEPAADELMLVLLLLLLLLLLTVIVVNLNTDGSTDGIVDDDALFCRSTSFVFH